MEGLVFLVVLALVGVLLVLPILSFVLASRASSRVRALEEANARLQRQLDALEARAVRGAAAGEARAARASSESTEAPAAPPAAVPRAAPAVAPPAVAPPAVAPPAMPAVAAPPVPATARAPLPSAGSRPPRPPGPAPSAPAGGGFDWEGLIGVRLFSAVAGIALVIAAVFFLRYSVERGWLEPRVRVAIGILTGIALLFVCERKAAGRYRVTANALDAAAVSILFATVFAAHALWQLMGTAPTFLLLALVATVAVLLSIRHESLLIALLGLLGGFSTPILLSTGQNQPIGLFGYLLLLNVGLAWVARARGWPLLTRLSLVLTTLYQWGWVFKFLDAAQLPLAMGIFVILPAAAFGVARLAPRGKGAVAARPDQGRAALVGASLPLLFAVYLAAVPAYGARFVLLFGFLFLLDAALFAIAVARGTALLHALGGAATLLTLAIWLAVSYSSEAWPAILAFLALFVVFYLAGEQLWRRIVRVVPDELSHVSSVSSLLLAALPAIVALEPAVERPLLFFSVALALLALLALAAIVLRRGGLYFVAAFFVLAAEAVWTARYLTPERFAPALALEVLFGVAYLVIPLLARRRGRPLTPSWGGGAVLIAALLLLFALSGETVAASALFGLALLLAILNGGLFVEAAHSRLSALSLFGGFLSWIVLGAWWIAAAGAVPLLASLAVVTGLALLMVAGHVWAGARAVADTRFGAGCALGLVAHLFLIAVAKDDRLGLPPWPLLVVLLVMTLAFMAAALRLRRGALLTAASVAAALVLLVWEAASATSGGLLVALAALAAQAALALGAIPLARRAGDRGGAWIGAAAAALFALQLGAVLASGANAPSTGVLALVHVVAIATLLALDRARGSHQLGLLALATSTIGLAVFAIRHGRAEEWPARLGLAAAIYVVFLAWPLVSGRSAGAAREPWLGAIVASLPFFFVARQALVAGGLSSIIGVLPLAQALAMALLLRRLLSLERGGRRDEARLALVAGTALGFVTLAIPLQLEKQWITIAWALEGAALAWLYRRIAHRGLLACSAGLLGAVFVRLALNPWLLHYAPRSGVPVLNLYLYTYLVSAVAFVLAGLLLARSEDRLLRGLPRTSTLAHAGAGVLLFLLLNIEIADFFAEGEVFRLRLAQSLGQDLTFTIGWLAFGVVLLGVGIASGSRGARLTALALVAITACKGFLYDLSRLGGLYRVASFVGLALALALVSLALQKFVSKVGEKA